MVSPARAVVRKNSIRLPSDRDAGTYLKELSAKGAKVNEVKDDLFGPGSGEKWFNLQDPDGNPVLLVQV